MPTFSLPALQSGKPAAWEEAIYAFLVEKRARSGSTRTSRATPGCSGPSSG
jgi:hypothetical protein